MNSQVLFILLHTALIVFTFNSYIYLSEKGYPNIELSVDHIRLGGGGCMYINTKIEKKDLYEDITSCFLFPVLSLAKPRYASTGSKRVGGGLISCFFYPQLSRQSQTIIKFKPPLHK